MLVRPAQLDDAHRIAVTHVDSWRAAYQGILPDAVLAGLSIDAREALWDERLAAETQQVLVVEDGDGVVQGWARFGPCRDADVPAAAEVYGIYLDPKIYRQGYGRHLWAAVLRRLADQHFERLVDWVLRDNYPARRFYEAMGGHPEFGLQKTTEQEGVPLVEVRYSCPVPKSANRQ